MFLWYALRSRRARDTGKFRSQARLGTKKSPGDKHRGWSYHFVSHRTGSSVRRTTYSVAISDPHQNRRAYLRDFSSVEQAAAAAREWIDRTLNRVLPKSSGGEIGTIPAVPAPEVPASEAPAQEEPDQEK